MLLPSGPANTRCSVCPFEPGGLSCETQPGARNGFAEPRERQPKSTLSRPQLATETARPAFEPTEMPANCGLFFRDLETSVRIGLCGGPGSSDTRQSGQWLACQTAPKGPFERKRVSQQVSKLELYVCRGTCCQCCSRDAPMTDIGPLRAFDPQTARTAKRFCRLAGGRRFGMAINGGNGQR